MAEVPVVRARSLSTLALVMAALILAGLLVLVLLGTLSWTAALGWGVALVLALLAGQLAARLRATELRLSAVSAGLPELAFLLDDADRVVEVFARQPELLLVQPAQLIGQDPVLSLPPALQAAARSQIRQARSAADSALPLEYSLTLPSGTARWFEARFIPTGPLAGVKQAVLIVARDITEERQLRRWQDRHSRLEALGRLAGGVAHDLNNALQMIFFSASFLRDSLPADAQQQADLQDLLGAASRAQEVARHLLTFRQRPDSHPPPLDIGPVLAQVVAWYQRTQPTLTLHLALAPAPCIVAIDASSVERILGNLITNARNAMEGPGRIEVTLSDVRLAASDPTRPGLTAGDYACLEVRDHGPGLSPDVIEDIFEPFYTTRPHSGGTGLGLATVYALVRQHGGHIQAGNHSEGGAVFTIHLPCAVAAPAPAAPQHRLLLVDDEETARRPLARALLGAGYLVDEADSGAAALELFQATPDAYSAVITDMMMPRMSGVELVARLHQLRPALPVLIVTGFADVQIAPPIQVLYKPFETAALLRVVAALAAP